MSALSATHTKRKGSTDVSPEIVPLPRFMFRLGYEKAQMTVNLFVNPNNSTYHLLIFSGGSVIDRSQNHSLHIKAVSWQGILQGVHICKGEYLPRAVAASART